MKPPLSLTKSQAISLMLRWQGLMGPPRFIGRQGIVDFIRQAGCVQFDPLDVCGRSPELTLHARVREMEKQDLRHLLYEEHVLLDHWDKNMSILHREDFPRLARLRRHVTQSLRQHPQVEEAKVQVMEAIRAHGPLNAGALAFEDKVDWWWAPTSVGRATLETLYQGGDLVVFDRSGTTRTFDLAERHLDAALRGTDDGFATDAEYYAYRVLRRIRAVGLLWDKRSDAYLSIEQMKAKDRTAAFARLEEQGRIVPLRVEGIQETLYAPAEALPLLDAPESPLRTELIAPLDSFLWDRNLIEALFGFYYRWEVYTPKEKRQWGYYVLPVLQGERLVGRLELKRDRQRRCLRQIGAWWEHPVDEAGLHECLDRLCRFDGQDGWEVGDGNV